MSNILAVGIATVDIINTVEHYPAADDEVRAVAQSIRRGGNASNTLVLLAALGHRCSWAGTLADDIYAGFIRNEKGELTTKKARVQVVIFNAITKFRFNRRSHDKLLVADGAFPDKAVLITGGRNISLDYYGINEDGSKDRTGFSDVEMLLRPGMRSEN